MHVVFEGAVTTLKCTIRQAPTGNRLTDAQLTHFSQVSNLYDGQDPSQLHTYERRAKQVVEWFSAEHRRALVDALAAYGQKIHASSVQLQAMEKLRHPNSVAVVTGQQAGLLTGPLYSISKALSAVGLARQFEHELGRPVVPVFWVASEDHDFGEVDHAYYLDAHDAVNRVSLAHQFDTHQMVYYGVLSEAQVSSVLTQLQNTMAETAYKAEMLNTLRTLWNEGDTLAVWFARTLATLLSEHPIVIVDPCLPELRNLVAPVFLRTLQSFDALQVNLGNAYEEVKSQGFSPEVIRDEQHSTVFHVVDGKRYVMERQDNGFNLRGLNQFLSMDDCERLVEDSPERFSSNVLLRPVVQDHLLPTLAYVGGPSEIAYHPLSRAVFHTHERVLPPLIMRQRMRVATPPVLRCMNQWGVTFEQVATPVDLVAQFALNDVVESLDSHASNMRDSLANAIDVFKKSYQTFGPQVSDIVDRQWEQHNALIGKLERKIYRLAERRRNDDVRQLQKIERWFWMDGHEQERRMSPMNIWAELGLTWFQEIPVWGNYQQPAPILELSVE